MEPAPTQHPAVSHDGTARWLSQRLRWGFGLAASGAATIVVSALLSAATGSPVVAVTFCAGALGVAAGVWALLGWMRAKRVLDVAMWRDATITANHQARGATYLEVSYGAGMITRCRTDGLTRSVDIDNLTNATTVWVASCPTGTVIAAAGPRHVVHCTSSGV